MKIRIRQPIIPPLTDLQTTLRLTVGKLSHRFCRRRHNRPVPEYLPMSRTETRKMNHLPNAKYTKIHLMVAKKQYPLCHRPYNLRPQVYPFLIQIDKHDSLRPNFSNTTIARPTDERSQCRLCRRHHSRQ